MRVTHEVVSDLWPLYASGEASADTRTLVDEHLRGHPDFARRLEAPVELPAVSVLPRTEKRARSCAPASS